MAESMHTATLLPDGEVLIASSYAGGVNAELYDPVAGTFTATGSLSTAREGHTACLLPNGKVLIAGGRNYDNSGSLQFLASAELYDLTVGAFAPTGTMSVPRQYHTATLLTSGKVLIAGGLSDGGDLASAELYDPEAGAFGATGSMSVAGAWHTATLLTSGKVLIAGGGFADYETLLLTPLASAELYE
jgi:hypothetical protein